MIAASMSAGQIRSGLCSDCGEEMSEFTAKLEFEERNPSYSGGGRITRRLGGWICFATAATVMV